MSHLLNKSDIIYLFRFFFYIFVYLGNTRVLVSEWVTILRHDKISKVWTPIKNALVILNDFIKMRTTSERQMTEINSASNQRSRSRHII